MKKTFNRNSFNEKLIHRYILESLYFYGGSKNRKNLLPNNVNPNDFKYAVPETVTKSNYRADFVLHFKNSLTIPLEVKWIASEILKKNNEHQKQYLIENNGYLIVFNNDIEASDVPFDILEIEIDIFQKWLATNIYKLSTESLVENKVLNTDKDFWLIPLRGMKNNNSAYKNYKEMIDSFNEYFWAFKNNPYITQNLFNLKLNDEILFLFIDFPTEKHTSLDLYKGKSKKLITSRQMDIFAWSRVSVKNPYYVCLDGPQKDFFEKNNPNPKQKYVHYFDFNILENDFNDDEIITINSGEFNLDNLIRESINTGRGSLVNISHSIYNNFYSLLLSE